MFELLDIAFPAPESKGRQFREFPGGRMMLDAGRKSVQEIADQIGIRYQWGPVQLQAFADEEFYLIQTINGWLHRYRCIL